MKRKANLNKDLTIIIPAYNEEEIIGQTVKTAISFLDKERIKGEVLVVENGSKDKTKQILKRLEKKFPSLRVFYQPVGNKGLALRAGMLEAKGKNMVLIDADLWDEEFVKACSKNLKKFDVVVGSKSIRGSKDNRPAFSRIMSKLYNWFFKVTFGFKGTESHAKLSFKTNKIIPLVNLCVTDGLVFDTELIIRAERAKMKKLEIPTEAYEIRPRTFSVKDQFMQVAKSYLTLIKALGVKR